MRSLPLILAIVLGGCRYSPTESDGGSITTGGALKTAFVRGTVALEGKSDSLHTDFSGVKIQLLGSNLTSVSDQQGSWRIDSVPPGAYHILYSLDGYDSVLDYTVQILAPAGALLGTRYLAKAEPIPYGIDTVWAAGLYPSLLISPLDSSSKRLSEHLIAGFASHSRDVGPLESQHDVALYARPNSAGGIYLNFPMSRAQLQQPNTPGGKPFLSGDSVYLQIYTCGTSYSPQLMYDATGRKARWMNLENPSRVVGFVLP